MGSRFAPRGSDLVHPIRATILAGVARAGTETRYRQPLLGFAAASDPGYVHLQQASGGLHVLPSDILPTARTVVSFFLPFATETVRANRRSGFVPRSWAVAYVETNKLISSICESLVEVLGDLGVQARWELPTYEWDEVRMAAKWSQKSSGYLAGLGTFGVHHQLITRSGCAGRFGSVIIDAEVGPAPRVEEEFCLHHRNGGCGVCVRRCPASALRFDGMDKQACWEQCLKAGVTYADLGPCEVCGRCSLGPCALGVPKAEDA